MADAQVLVNAVVRTMVDDEQTGRAIAFADGKITAVGDEDQVLTAAGVSARVEDLGGRTVLPGFIDAHHHFSHAVLHQAAVDCKPAAAPTIEAIVENIRNAAIDLPPGAWVMAEGYDELAIKDKRHPTREDLDRACPDRPVILGHYSGHEGVANSRALELAGYGKDTPDPQAGEIVKDRRKEPTGRLVETASSRVWALADSDSLCRDLDGFLGRIGPYEDRLFAAGITRVCDPTVSTQLEEIYRQAMERSRLRMPVLMLPCSQEGHLCPPWDRLEGTRTGHGPEHLRVGHLKIFFDGANRCAIVMSLMQFLGSARKALAKAIRSRSLAVLRGANDMQMRLGRDRKVRLGLNFFEVEDGRKLVSQACQAGFSIAIHAIGNEAVDRAIDVIEHSRGKHPDSPPPQIIHTCIIGPDAAKRMAGLGIVAVVQPYFLQLPVFDTMPRPPGLRFLAFKTLLDAGVRLAGSSDAPVTGHDPLEALRSAITRRSWSGGQIHPEEALSARQVLGMYTREAAHALGCLDVTGTLETGKRADLVVLSGDPCRTSQEGLLDLCVERTVLRGETVYTRSERTG